MTTLHDYFKEEIKLPSPPVIAIKILEVMGEDENSFEKLVQIVETDPALTARMLKIANSSFYGFVRPVVSVGQASALIGFDALKNIALSFVIVREFHSAPKGFFDLNLFWRRAVTAAIFVLAINNSQIQIC